MSSISNNTSSNPTHKTHYSWSLQQTLTRLVHNVVLKLCRRHQLLRLDMLPHITAVVMIPAEGQYLLVHIRDEIDVRIALCNRTAHWDWPKAFGDIGNLQHFEDLPVKVTWAIQLVACRGPFYFLRVCEWEAEWRKGKDVEERKKRLRQGRKKGGGNMEKVRYKITSFQCRTSQWT